MINHPVGDRPPASPDVPLESAGAPGWWLGNDDRFAALCETRLRIHRHEKAAARKAVSLVGCGVIAAASIYSIDATGAVAIPAQPGFVAFFASVALLAMAAWVLDRRLLQQLEDVHLRSRLWLDLVDAVKEGCIDVRRLEMAAGHEGEIERLLRTEAALAWRFLASGRKLALHLPIFGHCFTLENN